MPEDFSSPLRFLPVGLNLQAKNCLVVGGGTVGARKALTLTRAGARVTVVSPAINGELEPEVQAGRIQWRKAVFRQEHLAGVFLAVAATDDQAVNAAVVRAAGRHGALVCDASSAQRSQVIFGALLEGSGFTAAVFTAGRDPALARQVRDQIADYVAEGRPAADEP